MYLFLANLFPFILLTSSLMIPFWVTIITLRCNSNFLPRPSKISSSLVTHHYTLNPSSCEGIVDLSTMKFLLLLLAHALTLAYGVSESIYVGGWRNWTYSFEPLALPTDCSMEHAHGISIDDSNNIIVTYKDANDSSKCLLQWNAGAYKKRPTYLGPGKELCQGVAHGLTTTSLQDTDNQHALYHANNEDKYEWEYNLEYTWSSSPRHE